LISSISGNNNNDSNDFFKKRKEEEKTHFPSFTFSKNFEVDFPSMYESYKISVNFAGYPSVSVIQLRIIGSKFLSSLGNVKPRSKALSGFLLQFFYKLKL
jgi:hypothetical protein